MCVSLLSRVQLQSSLILFVINTATVKDDAFCEDGLPNHDSAFLTGRLKNSEVFADVMENPPVTFSSVYELKFCYYFV
jgi:hypothetical protein